MLNTTNYKSVSCVLLSTVRLVTIKLLLRRPYYRISENKRWSRPFSKPRGGSLQADSNSCRLPKVSASSTPLM